MLDNRFWSKVEKTPSCWNWTAIISSKGYGYFWLKGKKQRAHRVSYHYHIGKIPQGLQIDHLCRNRRCVNPEHLEAVTPKENVLRGVGLCATNSKKIQCNQGHKFTTENTILECNNTRRRCKKCHKVNYTNYRVRKKQQAHEILEVKAE